MTTVMEQTVSKSQFKSQVLQYLRNVEKKKQPLVITHGGKPVAKVIPYKEKMVLETLRKTVVEYKNPTEPVGTADWEAVQ